MATVEYLAIVQKSNTFCDSVHSFNRLIQVDSSIAIRSHKIIFKNDFTCDYKITSGEVKDKEQRYFHLHFSAANESQDSIDKFTEFLKSIRAVLAKLDSQPATLWDDISGFYSNSSYPLIHETENLMRKLIANFMLITIGIEWVDQTAPAEIKDIISKAKRKDGFNALHNIDFKDLADFLLKPYSSTSRDELHKKIKEATGHEDLAQIKKMLPESNWSRYFSNLVNCQDSFLQKRWMELYELRCLIAHNALVSNIHFNRIKELTTELKATLTEAINKLPQVQVPSEEVARVWENAAASGSSSLLTLLFTSQDMYEKAELSRGWWDHEKEESDTYSRILKYHLWKEKARHNILDVLAERSCTDAAVPIEASEKKIPAARRNDNPAEGEDNF